ncbi:MAG TPA: MOSC domain-containing protein [Chloroflexia bacterium]|nr:MOSC domain-containing protein [Chloroflexia bacterium]
MTKDRNLSEYAVSGLWRYPVKSMLGEALDYGRITDRGLPGDRAFALIDPETGKIASAKSPRKWGKLLDAKATILESADNGEIIAGISLPGGTFVRSDEKDCHHVLSNWLERPVKLMVSSPANNQTFQYEVYWPDIEGLALRDTQTVSPVSQGAAPGTFFNYAPLHLVTTSSLRRLQMLAPQSAIVVRRFRPNIIVETLEAEEGFIENAWIGHTLAIGPDVRLRVTVACPRCVVTTLPQENQTLMKDNNVLRSIVEHNRVDLGDFGVQACFGVYAEVLEGGVIRPGDKLVVL